MSLEDKAQEHEQKQWELRNVDRPQLPPPAKPEDPDYGPPACEECEGPMPAVRRSYRCTMCTGCTSEAERLAGLRRRRG